MTDVIVTDVHNTVIVGTQQQTTVVTVDTAPRTIVTGMMGPSGSSAKLSDAHDVDVTDLSSGSLLVYNPTVSKWVATLTLDQQYMDGGHF